MEQFKRIYGIELYKKKINEIIFIFTALEIIFAFSYLGYMDFQFISTTTLHVLVIAAAMLFGIRGAIPVAIVFALTSMWAGTMAVKPTDQIFSPFISGNPLGSLMLGGIRLLFAVLASAIYRLYFLREKKYRYLPISIIAVLCTGLYSLMTFGGIYFFFPKVYRFMLENFKNLPAINDLSFYLVAIIGVCLIHYCFSNEKVQAYLTVLGDVEDTKKKLKYQQSFSFYLAEVFAAILGILVALYLWRNFQKELDIGQIFLPKRIQYYLQLHLLQFYLAFTSVMAILGVIVKWISEYYTVSRIKAEKDAAELRRLRREQEITEQLKEKNTQLENQQEQLKIAIEEANQANRAKSIFLNHMSHDIRTPMNAIIGFTTLAKEHLDQPEQVLEYLKKISISSQHLLSLINDVLDMRRIESGKIHLEEKVVHLPDVIHDLKTIVQTDIVSKKQKLNIDIFDVMDEDIMTDPLRLNQVLLNILSNAIKYTPAGGTITMHIFQKKSTKEHYANYEFVIKDTGIGMSEQFQKHIFDEFSREENSTVKQIQGTGLGMTITKSIVDMMSGRIDVKSELGKGSQFNILLPFKINKEIHNQKIEELQGLRVLVVDANPTTCFTLCAMLKKLGMVPEEVYSKKEAVLKARDAMEQGDEYKAYIIDWVNFDRKSLEEIKKIHQSKTSSPTILLTIHDKDDGEEVDDIGVSAFCTKPLFVSELAKLLSKSFCINKEEQKKRKESIDFKGKRILLVEDNELNQEIACTLLEERGFIVSVANDGREAVDLVSQMEYGQYDLILMDIQMPKMDGYEATKKIRTLDDQQKASLPIIAMTANAFEEDKQKAFKIGMNGHIAKPVNVEVLEQVLTEILL